MVAEEHAKLKGVGGGSLKYQHMTADDLIQEKKTFDVVVCSEVMSALFSVQESHDIRAGAGARVGLTPDGTFPLACHV